MNSYWEKKEAGETLYIQIETFHLIFGSHAGSGHTDNAGRCSHADFLAGMFQKEIGHKFGIAVLDEVKAAVRAAADDPAIAAARQAIERSNEYLMSLPEAPELASVRRHADTVNGYFNYGNSGGYKTVLESDRTRLTVEGGRGYVENENGDKHEFVLGGHCSAVVERADHYFLAHTDHFAEIDAAGRIRFDTAGAPELKGIFGADLRIKNCFRHGDTIFAAYWWFGGMHPDGLLKYESPRGFSGRLLIS